MKTYRHAALVMAVAFTSIGLAWAQQSSSVTPSDSKRSQKPQPLITIDGGTQHPFLLNRAAAADLARADEQFAAEKLHGIKQDITDLITRYPESAAAKEMSKILDKADLKVIPGYGVYPKSTICITIPFTR